MRRSFTKIPYPVTSRAIISAAFSTSSAGGGGRGRGGSTPFQFTADSPNKPQNESNNSKDDESPSLLPHGHGRGRGKPIPSFVNPPTIGRGRGFIPQTQESDPPPKPNVRMPFLSNKICAEDNNLDNTSRQEKILPGDIVNVLSGAGRGKPEKPAVDQLEKPQLQNRHIRPRPPGSDVSEDRRSSLSPSLPREQLSKDEQVKRAVGILSRGDADSGRGKSASSSSSSMGVRGVRGGRGNDRVARGRGGGRFGGRGRGRGGDRDEDSDDESGLNLGDPADGEKLAKKLGPKVMDQLAEAFEEMSDRVLPSPLDDAILDAFHTNMMIECEPEYRMEEFGTNPDIEEKTPIPLREALEKMKPFLMAYEGIQNEQEWQEVMEETMQKVPLIKEIVDHYCGPDRVTAKQQQGELERVAKTLPETAPESVKSFTNRAVLSLQSNPGWGFDKKCQFMDKLVMEVSQQYK